MLLSALSTEKDNTVPLWFLFQFLSIVFLNKCMLSSGTYDYLRSTLALSSHFSSLNKEP